MWSCDMSSLCFNDDNAYCCRTSDPEKGEEVIKKISTYPECARYFDDPNPQIQNKSHKTPKSMYQHLSLFFFDSGN